VLDQRELALGVVLDIEGACNYTYFDSLCTAMCGRGVDSTTVRWIRATLEGRLATAALNDVCMRVAVARGCRQGGVLLPLLWYVVVDDLIARLNRAGYMFKVMPTTFICWQEGNSQTLCRSSCRGLFTL
jgi:hypothetical protein